MMVVDVSGLTDENSPTPYIFPNGDLEKNGEKDMTGELLLWGI